MGGRQPFRSRRGIARADLEKRAAAAEADKQRTERAIDAFSSLYEAHGSLSEEVQSL